MIRRLTIAAALTLTAIGLTGCPHAGCYPVRIGGAPDNWQFINGTHQWITWVGGQPITMGYSLYEHSDIIWNWESCL
jgi:hypothetical protein